MTNLAKSLKEKIEELMDLEPYNDIRMKLILDNAIGDLNLVIKDEIKNLSDLETKVIMKEWKIIFERIKNGLNEFEINELEMKINAEIKILENEEKKIRNVIDCFKKSMSELLDLYTKKTYRFVKNIKTKTNNMTLI